MRQLHFIGALEVGVPKDIGWATATLRDNGTITRVCKGCLVEVVSEFDPETGQVEEVPILHGAKCPVWAAIQLVTPGEPNDG